ncbi:hypothetical protein MMC13_006460 [Lambiella insularis]|nr:hypothetical protein [Lambiella insularis]
MAGPGFSVTELLQAINKGKDIYNAFRDEYENAPARICELIDTLNYLTAVLQDVQSLLDQYGDVYPQEANFGRKLDEVEAFIGKYKTLKRAYGETAAKKSFAVKVRGTWLQAWQTAHYALDDQRARDLKDGLQLEIQKLLLFILVFALRRTVRVSRFTASNQASGIARTDQQARRPPARPIEPWEPLNIEAPYADQGSDDSFDGLFRRLLSVRYTHEREMNLAVQEQREPNLEHMHRNLELIWHTLNVRAGLAAENGRAPPLPRPRLLEAPSQNYSDTIVNSANSSIHTSIYSGSGFHLLPSSPPSLRRRLSSAASFSPSITSNRQSSFSDASPALPRNSTAQTSPRTPSIYSRRPLAPSINLGDPALPLWTATINLPIPNASRLCPIRLRDWEIRSSNSGGCLVWIAETDTEILEHYLPPEVFPRTLHSCHQEMLHVTFYEPHHLVFSNQDGPQLNNRYEVDYVFECEERRNLFQADLRGKDLIETLDINTIWSEREPRKYGEATFQDLKIWQDRHHPFSHTISFFASSTVNKVLEFPVLWFQPEFSERAAERIMELTFIRSVENSPKAGNASRRTSKIFSRRSTSISEHGLGTLSYSPPSTGTSLHSVATFASTSSEDQPKGELPDKLKRLKIQFTSKKGFESFIKLFRDAYRADKAPPPNSKLVSSRGPMSPTTHYKELDDTSSTPAEVSGSSLTSHTGELDVNPSTLAELPGSFPRFESFADPFRPHSSVHPTQGTLPASMSPRTSSNLSPDIRWGSSPTDFTTTRQ